MKKIILEIKAIERDYINGEYEQAYEKLHCLCSNEIRLQLKNNDGKNISVKKIIGKLEAIEEDFISANYDQAYTNLHKLCSEEYLCDQFRSPAMNIASQYHDYENCSINMTHDLESDM